jgi:hypothetical protein
MNGYDDAGLFAAWLLCGVLAWLLSARWECSITNAMPLIGTLLGPMALVIVMAVSPNAPGMNGINLVYRIDKWRARYVTKHRRGGSYER